MSNRNSSPSSSRPNRIYIGNLPGDVKESELDDLFYKFGRITDIDIKYGRTSNGTAYAFVDFDTYAAAESAVEARHGVKFDNVPLRVQMGARQRGGPDHRDGDRGPKRFPPNSGGSRRGGDTSRRSEYRVIVRGLPATASWQDLKDHMRVGGQVGYANVENGVGVVEYLSERDMHEAIRRLDGSEFRNPFDSRVISVTEGGRSRSRSPPRKRRSRSRSPRGDRRRPRSVSADDSPRQPRLSVSPGRRSISPPRDRGHSPSPRHRSDSQSPRRQELSA